MLAHLRRAADHRRRAGKVPVIAGDRDFAGQEIRHLHHRAALPRVGIRGGLRDGVHRGGDHIPVGKVGDGLGHGFVRQQFAHCVVHQFAVFQPGVAGVEARILQPFRLAEGVADPVPVVLVAGRYQHPALAAGVDARRWRGGIAPFRGNLGAVIRRYRDFGHGVAGVSQAYVHGLPQARRFAFMQRGQSADGGVEGGDAVNYRHSGADGGHSLLAGHHGDARHRLPDGVVADVVAVGAELPIGGYVDHNDAGVQGLQRVVAEAHIFDGAGAEILDQDVGNLDQFPQGFLAGLLAEVDGQGFFAGVVLHPVGGLFANPGAVVTGFLTAQAFNLDDFGAHPRQYLGAAGAGLVAAQVDDADVLQGRVDGCHNMTPYGVSWGAFYGASAAAASRTDVARRKLLGNGGRNC